MVQPAIQGRVGWPDEQRAEMNATPVEQFVQSSDYWHQRAMVAEAQVADLRAKLDKALETQNHRKGPRPDPRDQIPVDPEDQ